MVATITGSNPASRAFTTDIVASAREKSRPRPQPRSGSSPGTLFEIRDEYELHSTMHGGFSVTTLISRVYEARTDLDEGDEEWIVAPESGTASYAGAILASCAVVPSSSI
jgi:hypothetical protein